MAKSRYVNPFRPGAGHMPPYLAGRKQELQEFVRLLAQDIVLENMVLTGLRGVGKTVLLDTWKPHGMNAGWLWVGTDLSETTSLSELNICVRMLADLSVVTSTVTIGTEQRRRIGFSGEASTVMHKFDFDAMMHLMKATPGLMSDKLKAVLESAWDILKPSGTRGVLFAYDEAQNMKDHAAKDQFPLSLVLDVFQSIQRKGIPFMLLLTGLPTLFPKLVESRTFSERMFRVVFLDRLNQDESRDAVVKPFEHQKTKLTDESVELVVRESGGYPYFIQFICREVYDVFLRNIDSDTQSRVPIIDIKRKLDTDFFSGRWAKASDRQRELLTVVANLPNCDDEFTISDVAKLSKSMLEKPISSSQISSMFGKLGDAGLVYKNRHGKYSFAVPMLWEFILRQESM